VKAAGVVGAGTMGAGIAYVLAAAGYWVELTDADLARAKAGVNRVRSLAAAAAERSKLDPNAVEALLHHVHAVESLQSVSAGADLIVEAVPERLETKRTVLRAAERRFPTLLGSNTSGISITELGLDLRNPGRFLGMHFFNPVPAMPLVEVVIGRATAPESEARALEVVRAIGKEAVVVQDAPGFATSRLGVAIGLEAMRMVEQGVASPADIDRAMELGYRHPVGPLRLSDLVGLDVRLDIARNLTQAYGPRFEPPRILVEHVAQGHLGKKTGQGFYDWNPQGQPR